MSEKNLTNRETGSKRNSTPGYNSQEGTKGVDRRKVIEKSLGQTAIEGSRKD